MARVPVPAGRLIDRQLGGATPLAAPDATAGGRQVGEALQRFGAETIRFAEAQDEIDAKLDEAAAKKLDNDYADWSRQRLWSGDGAFYTLEGFDAANGRPGVETDIQKKREELLARASTPRQRRMAEEAIGRRADADLLGVADHSTKQHRVEEKRQSAARLASSGEDAVLYWKDPVRFQQELAVGEAEISAEGDRSGASPEMVALRKREWRSGIYGRVTKGMIARGDIEGAYAYRTEHEDKLLPADRDEIDDALYEPMAERHADAVVDQLLGYEPEEPASGPVDPGKPPKPSDPGPQPGARLDPKVMAALKARGIDGPVARGVAAGMFAENTSLDPNVRGGYKGRAVGLGQWLGPRRKRLFAKYGPNPTFDQQMDFLVWELNGGDHGGKAVLSAKTEEEALNRYIVNFMRPAPGAQTEGDLNRGMSVLGRKRGKGSAAGSAQQAPREHDLNELLARLDAMDLPFETKQRARRQLIERVGLDERLKDRESEKALEEASGYLDSAEAAGKPLTRESQIPQSVWSRMRPADRMNVRGVIARNAAPAPRQTDYGTYTQLSELYASNPAEFLKRDPTTYRNALDDEDYERVLTWRRDLMSAGRNGSGKQATHARITSVVGQARLSRGLDPKYARSSSDKLTMEKRVYQFEQKVIRGVELWQRANPGKEVPDSVILEIADRQLIETTEKDGTEHFWFERSGKGGYRIKMPRKDRDRLAAIGRKELGREPTDLEITEAYMREAGGY